MLVAVIGGGSAVGFDRDLVLDVTVGDGELAELGGDVVVVGRGALLQLVGEGVVAGAHQSLGAGDIVGGVFAGHKAFAGDGDLILGQRLAVILLGSGTGGQLDVALSDFQSAVSIGDGIAGGDILTGGVDDLGVGRSVVGLANIGLRTGDGDRLDAVAVGQAGGGSLVTGQRLTGIDPGIAQGGNGDGLGGDFQLTIDVGDVVAGGDILAGSVVDHGGGRNVVALAHHSLGTGDGDGSDAVAGGQSGAGVGVLGQSGAIVDLIGIIGGDGQRLGSDGQSAVGIGDVIAGGDVLALGVDDLGLTGDVGGRAHHGLRTGDGEAVQLVAGGQAIGNSAVLGQGSAVIGLGARAGSDGDSPLGDFQSAVNIGDGVVAGDIVAVVVLDHSAGSHVGGRTNDGLGTGDGDAVQLVALSQTIGNGAVLGQSGAVIDLGGGAGGDGQINGVDLQLAVIDHELNISEVVVRVLEMLALEAHGMGADVGAFSGLVRIHAHEGEVFLGVEGGDLAVELDAADLIAGDGVLGAVIVHFITVAGDGDHDTAQRSDDQLAVSGLGDDVLGGFIHGTHHAGGEGGGIGADLGALGTDGDGGEVGLVGSTGEAGDGVLGAVIDLGVALGHDLYVLIVVEVDHVAFNGDGDGLAGIGHGGVTGHIDGTLGDHIHEGLAGHQLGVGHLEGVGAVVPVVVNGVFQITADGPGAGDGHIVVGHGELAGTAPAGEVVALQLGGVGNGDGILVLIGGLGRNSGSAGRHFTGVLIGHGVLRIHSGNAGDGEGILLTVHRQVGGLVGGIEHTFLHLRVIDGDPIGHGVDVGGGIAAGVGLRIAEGPGVGAALGSDSGGSTGDINITRHGVGSRPAGAVQTAGDALGDGAEGIHQFCGIVGVIGVGLGRGRSSGSLSGAGNAVAQEVADGGAVAVGFFIGHAEADGVDLGVAAGGGLDGVGGVGGSGDDGRVTVLTIIGIAAAIGTTAISRRAVGQGDDVSGRGGHLSNGVAAQQGVGIIKAIVQIGAAALSQVVDFVDGGLLAGSGGHVGPVQDDFAGRGKVDDGQPAVGGGIGAGIAGDVVLRTGIILAVQEQQGGILGGRHAVLGGGDTIVGPPAGLIVGASAFVNPISIVRVLRICTALSAEAHGAGGVDDQDGGGRVGLERAAGGRLYPESDVIGVQLARDGSGRLG